MIARVSLEIALRKEFDYLIPPGLAGQIEVGSRVQVPFGPRKILGTVTALAGGIRPRESQTHSESHRRANARHAEGLETRALDCRLLLLRAGNRVEIRSARSRAQGGGRLEETIIRPRVAGERRISEAAETPAGSLEHHRGTARIAVAGIGRTGRNHRRHRPQTRRPRSGGNHLGNFRTRSVCARTHSAVRNRCR